MCLDKFFHLRPVSDEIDFFLHINFMSRKYVLELSTKTECMANLYEPDLY